MKIKPKKLPTEFGPEARFEFIPISSVPYREEQESRFEALKRSLLEEKLEEVFAPELTSAIRRAANEASALAWVTPFPLLFYPALFEEKAMNGVEVVKHQDQVRVRTRELLAV